MLFRPFDSNTRVSFRSKMPMKYFFCIMLLVVPQFFTACSSTKKKDSSSISGKIEEGYKLRWIANRMRELQVSGEVPDARDARRKAAEEFRVKYEYLPTASKPDVVGAPVGL
jgi:hypothetical protein